MRAFSPTPCRGLAAAVACIALAGCQLPGFVAANFMPRAKVKAVYEPIDQPTLVFLDDPAHMLPPGQFAGLIAETAAHHLQKQEVISQFVPWALLEDLRRNESEFASLPVDEIGRRLGAKQVIYVLVDAFDPGGSNQELQRPMAAARIKIVDVSAGRLFPIDGEHGVTSMLSFKQPPLDAGSHGRSAAIARSLAQQLGLHIAQQFYEHEQREIGSGFEDQI